MSNKRVVHTRAKLTGQKRKFKIPFNLCPFSFALPPLPFRLCPLAFNLTGYLQTIRTKIEECAGSTELGKCLLEEVLKLFQVRDAQLTLYYDLPIGLEVTHIRQTDSKVVTDVKRVREDEFSREVDDNRFLSPQDAHVSEMMTHRGRLVGMLLLGSKEADSFPGKINQELMREFITVVSAAIDQLMMRRRVSETNQKLFENEKLISIGQLASGIAHEIRNPLSSLQINLQGLSKVETLTKRDKQRIKICLEEIRRLDEIVGEVVSFAKRTRLEVAPTNAARLIEKSLELAQAEAEKLQIQIHKEIDPHLPQILADESRLIRVLLNLILNAIQAMEVGGRLELRAEPYLNGIEIQVTDNGHGIPKELQREIFNPFFTTKAEGTGLGLANAQKSIQEHGGEIEVISESGKGTTFSIHLPAEPPPPLEDSSPLHLFPR